jgi:hypothetical protein
MVGADDLGESCRRVLPSCLWPASQNTSHPSADRLAERFHGRAQRRTSLASRAPAAALGVLGAQWFLSRSCPDPTSQYSVGSWGLRDELRAGPRGPTLISKRRKLT